MFCAAILFDFFPQCLLFGPVHYQRRNNSLTVEGQWGIKRAVIYLSIKWVMKSSTEIRWRCETMPGWCS